MGEAGETGESRFQFSGVRREQQRRKFSYSVIQLFNYSVTNFEDENSNGRPARSV
jgi:hypothetical protein